MLTSLILLTHLSFTILSTYLFTIILYKYIKYKHYSVHSLTRTLAVVTFFLTIVGLYNTTCYMSKYGFLSASIFSTLREPSTQLIPIIGMFVSSVSLVYFIFERRIEEFSNNEELIKRLAHMNSELGEKDIILKMTEENLRDKIKELERYMNIAKEREKRLFTLESKLRAKSKA